ncbi:MAG: radical SAM domain-containing protein [Deltaproteobacteria bacterium]|nr:MAG: radical SAM domain-containing protein [Deltaproteobacteria bacterium]
MGMISHQIENFTITLNKPGASSFTKVSYPIRYGRYAEIKTPAYIFQFNLNHEIKYIQGHGNGWPSPSEWLKRTDGNDWVYYMAGDYSGVRDAFGEYYLPLPDYPTNSFITRNPFKDRAVVAAINAWQDMRKDLRRLIPEVKAAEIKQFLEKMTGNTPDILARNARHLHQIIGGRISVLPPDTRHVDYNVLPVIIADGCLYKCGFCRLKTRDGFASRTKKNIVRQIKQLKTFYGPDLKNYNALFLGLHDALYTDPGRILFAAETAYQLLDLKHSHLDGASLFLFGSADAILRSQASLFDALNTLPYSTYINIGLESADQNTLDYLRKPISSATVAETFAKIRAINKAYANIEITANFVYGDHLPETHLPSFFDLTRKAANRSVGKGTIYFSPLMGGNSVIHKNIVRKFYKIKTMNCFKNYLYLIQRL